MFARSIPVFNRSAYQAVSYDTMNVDDQSGHMKNLAFGLTTLIVVAAISFAGCGSDNGTGGASPDPTTTPAESASQARVGDIVLVHYTGRLVDGTVFESTDGLEPKMLTIGNQSMVRGFEKALIGMQAGELKTVEVPAEEGYGLYRADYIEVVDRDELPPIDFQIGGRLYKGMADGTMIPMTVIEVSETTVTLDGNHPLAGKDLVYEINLVEILSGDVKIIGGANAD
jgi:FKBP-type peptidyl-prolyl cis-trans isomerase 2